LPFLCRGVVNIMLLVAVFTVRSCVVRNNLEYRTQVILIHLVYTGNENTDKKYIIVYLYVGVLVTLWLFLSPISLFATYITFA
jgi:hypothetical protein